MNTTKTTQALCFPVNIPTLQKVMTWAAEAAEEQYGLGNTDTETGMGLWQAFQSAFPKDETPGNYDVYICAYSRTYAVTMTALVNTNPG